MIEPVVLRARGGEVKFPWRPRAAGIGHPDLNQIP